MGQTGEADVPIQLHASLIRLNSVFKGPKLLPTVKYYMGTTA